MNSKALPILTRLTTALSLICKESQKAMRRGRQQDAEYLMMVIERIHCVANEGLSMEPSNGPSPKPSSLKN